MLSGQKKLENSLTYKTTPEFWKYYQKLPRDIQSRADKQFQLLKQNPNHPSLMFKKRDARVIGQQELATTIAPLQFKMNGFLPGLDRETRRIQQPDMRYERGYQPAVGGISESRLLLTTNLLLNR